MAQRRNGHGRLERHAARTIGAITLAAFS
jgi:hypothetical protein